VKPLSPLIKLAIAAAVAFALVLIIVARLNCGSRDHAELTRRDEAAKLVDAGVSVADRVESIDPQLAAAEAQIAGLRAQVEKLKRAGGKPTSVGTFTTGPVRASGEPRPTAPKEPGDSASSGAGPTPGAPVPEVGACGLCLLALGDLGEVRVAEVRAATDGGNTIVAGAAECWRVSPAPAQRLFGGPFTAGGGAVTERVPPRESHDASGLGVGPSVGLTDRGAVVGGMVESPVVKIPLIGLRVSLAANAAGGPGGAVILGTLAVRP
jgi:hypothetical protein